MEIIIPEEVRRSPRLRVAVDRVMAYLEDWSRDASDSEPMTIEWGVYHDAQDRSGLDLAIAHSTGTASRRFPSEKISDEDFLEWEAGRIWRDILRVRSHVYLDRLHQKVAALTDEE